MGPDSLTSKIFDTLEVQLKNLIKDKTKRKYIEEQLKLILEMVENQSCGEFIYDKFGNMTLINQWIEECKSYTPDARTPEDWADSIMCSYNHSDYAVTRDYIVKIGKIVRLSLNQPEELEHIYLLNNIFDTNQILIKHLEKYIDNRFSTLESRLIDIYNTISSNNTTMTQKSGWIAEDQTWHYYNSDGELARNAWKKSGKFWFYLGSDGKLVKNQELSLNSKKYLLDEDGKLIEINGIKYLPKIEE